MNARLFRALKQAAETAQAREKEEVERLETLRQEIVGLLQPVEQGPLGHLLAGNMGKLSEEQMQALKSTQAALQNALQLVASERFERTGTVHGKS